MSWFVWKFGISKLSGGKVLTNEMELLMESIARFNMFSNAGRLGSGVWESKVSLAE